MPEDLSPDELERKKRLAGKFGQMLGRAVLSGASESISIVGSLFYKLRSGLSKKDRWLP